MTAIAIARPRVRDTSTPSVRHRRPFPVENLVMFALAAAFYTAVASYFVFHLRYMIGDAYARIDNAFDVLFTSDPHLGAIGFFWPPLPSFLELPIIAFKPLWPALVTQGFAGSIEAALFGAGTVVLFNSGLRWAGVVRPMRWLICLVWAVNPMTVIYAAQGMSEGPFVFFFVASILVFLRWADSRRSSLLPLMGVLAGLGCLCRNEAFFLAFLLGVGVVAQCVRDRAGWREIETEALLFALPAVLMIMMWIGAMGILLHDPLYWIHASSGATTAATQVKGPPVANPSAVSRSTAFGLTAFSSYRDAAKFIFGRSIVLFPGVVAFLILLGARLVIQPKRISGILLVLFGLCIPLLDTYIIHTGLAADIRYQIAVIPFTFIMAVYILRPLRTHRAISTVAAAIMFAALAASTVLTTQTLASPQLAQQEAPLLTALGKHETVPQVTGAQSPMDLGADLAPNILALVPDQGRILCDSSTCFPIMLNVPDATRFIVTSDSVFEAAAGQPQVYGVEYFLVPVPTGLGAFDRLNVLYPGLYENGSGFGKLVGSYQGWKVYRIVGPTGRGG